MAFFLFGDFLEEVAEFRAVVGEKDVYELKNHLKIHYRCQPYCTDEQKQGAIAIVQLLTEFFPRHIDDWRDLIKEGEQDDMEKLLGSSLASDIAKQKTTTKMPRGGVVVPTDNTVLLPPPPALYFDRSVDKLLNMFPHTHPEHGLPGALVPALREQYGINKLPDPPRPSALKMLWTQITDFMVLLLLAAAVVEAGQQEFNSMAVLLIVVVLNTVIGFTQEWKASKTLSALMDLSVPQAQVIRDGEHIMVDSEDLVPGDLAVLDEGDAVPADIRLIDVAQLELVESILTGESLPVLKKTDAIKAKSRRIPLGDCLGNAFMSTTVARGRGRGIVVRTGEQTEIGKISSAIQAGSKRKQKTPIQRRLDKLGKILVLIAIVLCALVVVIGIAWKHDVRTTVNIGLSLAVSVIPEGLVAVTTVTMALGVRRMAAKQCVVRTLPAVESLGSVTVICSDKTGTLTEGKMGASELWTADDALYRFTESTSLDPTHGDIIVEPAELRRRMIHVRRTVVDTDEQMHQNDAINYAAMRTRPIDRTMPNTYTIHLRHALMVSALCNNASVKCDDQGNWTTVGDPTEVALTVAAQKANIGRDYWTGTEDMQKVFERAFDSERKLMSTIYRPSTKNDNKGQLYMLCKGAPEELLRKCTTYLAPATTTSSLSSPLPPPPPIPSAFTIDSASTSSSTMTDNSSSSNCKSNELDTGITTDQGISTDEHDNHTLAMNDTFATKVTDESSRMASQGLPFKRVPDMDDEKLESIGENDFTFLGLIGLIDPPKQGVKESVETCQQAGIRVMMITGDHVETAVAIASQLGIFKRDVPGMSRAILGRELDLLSEEAIISLDPFPNVFARVSPDNKLTIVRALQQRGELVAMTGDGVNDAPAIKSADVGVAMGQAGTEITKQAADLVLLNDNFTTIVSAVEEGRHVFDNILKFIVYLLSCNGSEIFLMLTCSIANIETPFTVMMILWANIIADIPPAMALGVEPREKTLMKRSPRDPNTGVVTLAVWIVILSQSLLIAALTLGSYVLALYRYNYPVPEAQSLAFTCLTTIQLTHSFLSRSVHLSVFKTGLLSNRWMVAAFLISFFFLILGIYAPGISTWLELTYVGWQSWVMVIVSLSIHIIAVELLKLTLRRLKVSI
ncbi:calcium ATPase [Lichtheimia hyalospora FSU 10163]|nr:calcium ATPase [Lichtheimia hyalospora FSU 10163]